MSSRIFAAPSRDEMELSEDVLRVFFMSRLDPSERVNEISVFDLTSFLIRNCDSMTLDITGVSLNDCWISPEEVKEMYKSLEEFNPDQAVQKFDDWNCSRKDLMKLRKFLKACSECNLGLNNPPFEL